MGFSNRHFSTAFTPPLTRPLNRLHPDFNRLAGLAGNARYSIPINFLRVARQIIEVFRFRHIPQQAVTVRPGSQFLHPVTHGSTHRLPADNETRLPSRPLFQGSVEIPRRQQGRILRRTAAWIADSIKAKSRKNIARIILNFPASSKNAFVAH